MLRRLRLITDRSTRDEMVLVSGAINKALVRGAISEALMQGASDPGAIVLGAKANSMFAIL